MLANRRIKQSGHTNGNKIAASWQAWLATMHETNLGLYGPSERGLHACVFCGHACGHFRRARHGNEASTATHLALGSASRAPAVASRNHRTATPTWFISVAPGRRGRTNAHLAGRGNTVSSSCLRLPRPPTPIDKETNRQLAPPAYPFHSKTRRSPPIHDRGNRSRARLVPVELLPETRRARTRRRSAIRAVPARGIDRAASVWSPFPNLSSTPSPLPFPNQSEPTYRRGVARCSGAFTRRPARGKP
jgi:hypothetical protein